QRGESSFYNMGLWITSPFHFRVYANMLHAVTTGKPGVEKVTGLPVFEYFAQPENRELSEIFNNAMTGFSAQVGPAALESYDFSGIGTLVDVAGGPGQVATARPEENSGMAGRPLPLPHRIR